ncbi:MAG: cyclic nucleotide-binding domain-containing protein [Chitinivibrionales bacterium]|nr:cyclic nucleotide-binding domain-containing protein [Chitinivibrionales bacterium]
MTTSTVSETIVSVLENIVFLKKTQIFSALHTYDIKAVAEIAEELTFRDNQRIVKENDLGDSMYLIKSGTVRISKMIDEKNAIDLAELGAGDCFGDMSVFDAEVRSASVYAQNECVLLRINGTDLIDVILECPHIAIELLKIFIQRLRKANKAIQELSSAG